MATFTDREQRTWQVVLDAPTIEEITELHGVNLVDLSSDPLQKLRNDPMLLVAVIYLICQRRIEELSLSHKDFARSLPSPPDEMFDAVRAAIVGFFPTGQASHVQEVLAKYDTMATKTNELQIAKMQKVLDDPATNRRLSNKADTEIARLMNELFPMPTDHGT